MKISCEHGEYWFGDTHLTEANTSSMLSKTMHLVQLEWKDGILEFVWNQSGFIFKGDPCAIEIIEIYGPGWKTT